MHIIQLSGGEYWFSNSVKFTDLSVKLQGKSGTLIKANTAPIFIGVGSENINCYECGVKLISNIQRDQIENITIECPECGAFNKL
jgi:predicted RNA-binding Zn-ribbon protein involved in translation (DUF1610 family)